MQNLDQVYLAFVKHAERIEGSVKSLEAMRLYAAQKNLTGADAGKTLDKLLNTMAQEKDYLEKSHRTILPYLIILYKCIKQRSNHVR
ncbi:hypothetical protein [uncultured Mediterranean phage uvMED]|nr:hypothetical protein [uncultured Mediterranean phage uvMED]